MVVARVRALFGRTDALGDAHAAYGAAKASETVLLGLRLCAVLALLGLTDQVLPGEVVLVRSGPGAKA